MPEVEENEEARHAREDELAESGDYPWGIGVYDEGARRLLTENLRADELEVAKELHLGTNWPPVRFEVSAVDLARGIGKHTHSYRMEFAQVLLRLAYARKELSPELHAVQLAPSKVSEEDLDV